MRFTFRIGSVYLRPRASVVVEEPPDFMQLVNEDTKCGSCTLSGERTYKFKVCFLGGGSLESAWSLYNVLEEELQLACDGEEILLRRRVFDETELVYRITKASIRIVDPSLQYDCERTLCAEVSLTLVAAVVNQRVPSPVSMRISFPRPVVNVATAITPTPIAAAISFPAPAISSTIDVEPLVLDTAFPGHIIAIGGIDSVTTAGVSSFCYNYAKQKLWSGQIDLDTDDIRMLLVMTSNTADTEDDVQFIDKFTLLDEFNGAGYARQALANEAVNADAGNSRAEFDADDVAFGALSNGTRSLQGAVIFKFVTNDTDSIPICYLANAAIGNFNPGGSTITFKWSAEGIMWHV